MSDTVPLPPPGTRPPAGGLHVVAGPSAAACLEQGLGLAPDQLLVHHDLLSCGPLPPLDSLDDWRDVREAYLQSLEVEREGFSFADCPRDLLTNRERLTSAATITLWLGTGLPEQLLLAWIVALLRRLDSDPTRCRIVQFDRHDSYEIVGAGVLHPSEFAQHPPSTSLDATGVDEALSAWAAVTAAQPRELLAFLGRTSRALPILQRSLSSVLYHYPHVDNGLNAWEHRLLQYVGEVGPKASRAIGYTMAHDMDFPEWMADSYLFERLHRLANEALPRPLLALSGDTTTLPGTEVRLTEHGEALLAGGGNAVAWNGIDDWVGGVHLESRSGQVWFRSEQTLLAGA
ncbi:MAG TPA: DUF1835 domain-containing protein [Candidatus Limnocylindria bacterium]|nr:DUF1835 domain-containing protein [Candidatus Limnocylindria bacterium]